MRHVILTCRNHPDLRWSTKEIAFQGGRYNGTRSIFFKGRVSNPVRFYKDMSGIDCDPAAECPCKADCLVVAPEDAAIAAASEARAGQNPKIENL